MPSKDFLRWCFAIILVLVSGASSYAQSKSAVTSITVYQDPG
jgi:hypothetical protein